jgi:hypothetical protein
MADFMSIYKDPDTGYMICSPFGKDYAVDAKLAYTAIDEIFLGLFSWVHLSCSYAYSVEVRGTVYTTDYEQIYTSSLADLPLYLPSDQYQVYLGNSHKKN